MNDRLTSPDHGPRTSGDGPDLVIRPAEEVLEGEKKLLVTAKDRMASLPFNDIDVLVIDRMGKNISGTGMDTNVTGRNRDILGDFTTNPKVKRLFVRDLTDESEGNATGIGLADFTTTRFVNKIDRKKTYINCLTGISPEKGAIPIYFDTDLEALEACFMSIGDIPVEDIRLVHGLHREFHVPLLGVGFHAMVVSRARIPTPYLA